MSRQHRNPAHRDEGPHYALYIAFVAWLGSLGTCWLALAGWIF